MLYLCVLLLVLCAGAADAQECSPHYTFTLGDAFGSLVSNAGDVDNDGYVDLIVGASWKDAGGDAAGQTYVYSGRTGELLWTFTGEAAGDRFGCSASGAGDVDNDGYADLIVGAFWNDAGGDDAGRAYVYSGRTGGLLWTFSGEAEYGQFANSVSGAGDVDDDGYADVIVGAWYGGDDRTGRAYVYSGRTGGLLWTLAGDGRWNEQFGRFVYDAGDVDNDGHVDVAVTSSSTLAGNFAGRVWVYSGRTGGLLWTRAGTTPNESFGCPSSGAGDVDNDGYADLVFGANMRAYVYSGRTSALLWTFVGETTDHGFGQSVSGAGDVDNDGHDDVIVGANGARPGGCFTGRAYVYSGRTGALLGAYTGTEVNAHLGWSVSSAGDVDDDGYADLAIVAMGCQPEPPARVYVYTCIGAPETPLAPSISGIVTADCPVPNTGLAGIVIDLYEQGTGDLVSSALTDANGNYLMEDLTPGDYIVTGIISLSYDAIEDEIPIALACGAYETVDFLLTCVVMDSLPPGLIHTLSSAYWKGQVGELLKGKVRDIDAATLCGYLDLIEAHFNSNAINQVVVYEPPSSGLCMDKLLVAGDLLNARGDSADVAKARQELMALLLNVASGKISQTAIISVDSATVSQAITYCDNIIDDPNGDYHLARDICKEINKNKEVAAGVIDLSTDNIPYKLGSIPESYSLNQNYPNPFNPVTEISFSLPAASHVKLEIFNTVGQKVATLIDGQLEAGEHTIQWDGRDVASGIYFYRVTAGEYSEARRMLLLK
jgi:hypothetical protein